MRELVRVAAWRHQCCGDAFAVGDTVTWPLDGTPDRDRLSAARHPEPGSAVLVDLERAVGLGSVPTGERWDGYVVELEPELESPAAG